MPAEFYIDVPRRMVFSRGTGILTLADATAHMDGLLAHPDFCPEFHQLLDFSQVREIILTGDEIRSLAERNIFSPRSRRAFVISTDLHFGLARMFGAYREIAGEHGILIFRELTPALAALELTAPADPRRFLL